MVRNPLPTSSEDGIPEILAEQRLGHQVPGMRGLYAHASQQMREDLKAALQARWDESLRKRAAIDPHSPVQLLDNLLAPFRAASGCPDRGDEYPAAQPKRRTLMPALGPNRADRGRWTGGLWSPAVWRMPTVVFTCVNARPITAASRDLTANLLAPGRPPARRDSAFSAQLHLDDHHPAGRLHRQQVRGEGARAAPRHDG
jgi:hypothetical protein